MAQPSERVLGFESLPFALVPLDAKPDEVHNVVQGTKPTAHVLGAHDLIGIVGEGRRLEWIRWSLLSQCIRRCGVTPFWGC